MNPYILIESNNLELLEEAVSKKLNDGYVLQGGVSIATETGENGKKTTLYAQAMVNEEFYFG